MDDALPGRFVLVDVAGPADAWLGPRRQMEFRPVTGPIVAAVAKLGGQPVWLEAPAWPMSRATGEQMVFIGQFPVPGDSAGMAYLFIADDDAVGDTMSPAGGDNALLIQPGGRIPSFVAVEDRATGPSLWRRGATWFDRTSVELAVDLVRLDPAVETVLDAEIAMQEAERAGEPWELPEGSGSEPIPSYSYVGGKVRLWQPHLLHQDIGPGWRFFFQLDGCEGADPADPYALNFGGGTGYAFISADGLEGRFFWDCV
jgi:hypothetical protein